MTNKKEDGVNNDVYTIFLYIIDFEVSNFAKKHGCVVVVSLDSLNRTLLIGSYVFVNMG